MGERSSIEPAVADGVAGDVVAAALDREQEMVLGGEADGLGDVGGRGTADDGTGPLVDHRVPDGARVVVAGIAGQQHVPVDAVAQGVHGTVADRPLAGVEGRQGEAGHGCVLHDG
jgi:hypothetical protein